MDTEKIKEINVNNFIDVSAILKQLDIENAKQVLKSAGYYVDNLWQTCDVTINYDCTEEEAQKVLDKVFRSESTFEDIWMAISYQAESINLKRRD